MIPFNDRNSQCRKLRIKNLKSNTQKTSEYLDAAWNMVMDAVEAIYKCQPVHNLEDLYRRSAELVESKQGARMYDHCRELCVRYTRSQIEQLKSSASSTTHLNFLIETNGVWSRYTEQLTLIRSILLQLDRTYALHASHVSTLWDMGLNTFRHYLLHCALEAAIVAAILDLIDRERQGESVDRGLLKSMCTMMVNLRLYDSYFEESFLQRARQTYDCEGNTFMVQPEEIQLFVQHCSRRLVEEETRSAVYLAPATGRKIVAIIDECLLRKHVLPNLFEAVSRMLDAGKYDELKTLNTLIRRLKDGHKDLCRAYADYIKTRGKLIVVDPNRDKTMVDDLLKFKAEMDFVLRECLPSPVAAQNPQSLFLQAQKDAFESSISQRPNKPAELIAKYADNILRIGNKENTEEELETVMDKLLTLFRYVQGKDVFEAYYKKDLAKRLLLGKSASVDAEKLMLQKLKNECGATFTYKLESMFKDVELSKDIMLAYREFLAGQTRRTVIEHNVSILTTGTWPTYQPSGCVPTPEMEEHRAVFERFYLGKHNGRKLVWVPSLGQCHVEAYYPKGTKSLIVSEHQCLVLTLFNGGKDELSYEAIARETKIDEEELKYAVLSMVAGKSRLLTKEPKGMKFLPTDIIRINLDFQDKHYKIKVNQAQAKETAEEHAVTEQRIALDRQYMIDAAIVRIMKARKNILHQALIGEVFAQVKFQLKAGDVKKRIESLIERDYMERDKDDSSSYHYVA